jgi:hypothetical protein
MNGHSYIISRQTQWALNHGLSLTGSKIDRGLPTNTTELDQNLFRPLSPETRESFELGDGGEIHGNPAKMQAVHSSSALGVNVFQYWQEIGMVPEIASACGFCQKGNEVSQTVVFEDKYIIDENKDKFPFAPNIDVVIHNSDSVQFKRFAIECKFTEAYGSRAHTGLKPPYLELTPLWQDIPNLFAYAKTICPDEKFTYLHSAQLVKHILGLKRHFGKNGFKLLYLWYDVLGKEGAIHQQEIDVFSGVTKADGIHFSAMSYQELIHSLSEKYRQEHPEYIRYLTERYL